MAEVGSGENRNWKRKSMVLGQETIKTELQQKSKPGSSSSPELLNSRYHLQEAKVNAIAQQL